MARPKSLETIVREGGTRESLEALRDRLAQAIDSTTSARDVASLANRLTAVLVLLDEMDARERGPRQQNVVRMGVTRLDAIASRRAERRASGEG